ncbi:MAG: lytic murein transglycosylase B [Gammaproteobacteria bacterium]|nr:lytic murein transglycosylase B [Gammaproteobacteria bacterium]
MTTYFSKLLCAAAITLGCFSAQAAVDDFPKDQVDAFVERMQDKGFEETFVLELLNQAEHQQAIIDAISRPAEGVLHWHKYRKIFLKPKRINDGVTFWNKYEPTLARAEKELGVPPEYIVAIIGVETWFGTYTGKWRVLDALTTLGFNYPKRGKFFTSELEHFFLMTREQALDPLALKGSYAGAMGLGQFISSSYRHYAIDFDGDEIADLWNPYDAIGSVANYFAEHGWKAGETVILPAKTNGDAWQEDLSKHGKPAIEWQDLQAKGVTLQSGNIDSDEKVALLEFNLEDSKLYYVPLNNFYAITRYNHSKLYALAVHQLAQEIAQARQQ